MRKKMTILAACACAMTFGAVSPTLAQAAGPTCMPYVIESSGQSAAAFKKAREKRAKRRAVRRWTRAVEGRLLGARGVAIPAAGTVYSNFDNAQVESFNCSGRPLKCILRARPCRAG
jgi:hypothetical protein